MGRRRALLHVRGGRDEIGMLYLGFRETARASVRAELAAERSANSQHDDGLSVNQAVEGFRSGVSGDTPEMLILETKSRDNNDVIGDHEILSGPATEDAAAEVTAALHELEVRFGTSIFADGLSAFQGTGYGARLDAIRPERRDESRRAIEQIYQQMEKQIAEQYAEDHPEATELVARDVAQKARDAELKAKQRAAEQLAAAVPTPACPSWCTEDEGHPYKAESVGEFTRDHQVTTFPAVDSQEGGGVMVEQYERSREDDGVTTLDPPEIYVEFASSDPTRVRLAGQALIDAAAMLEGLSADNTG